MIGIGVLVMNLLDATHVLEFITEIIKLPANLLLGLPPEIAPIMLLNFLRKDASVALLVPLDLTAKQFIIASIFLTLSTPCVASFFSMIKELGIASALKLTGLVFFIAIASTSLLHMLFILF
jgi:ferrous iron transport protein B